MTLTSLTQGCLARLEAQVRRDTETARQQMQLVSSQIDAERSKILTLALALTLASSLTSTLILIQVSLQLDAEKASIFDKARAVALGLSVPTPAPPPPPPASHSDAVPMGMPVCSAVGTTDTTVAPLPPVVPALVAAPPQPAPVAATSAASTAIMVTCPPGVEPGGQISVQDTSGRIVLATVPVGVASGQSFQVVVPAVAVPVAVAHATPAAVAQPVRDGHQHFK